MPLIFSPRELSRRAELYHQFSRLIEAGLPLLQTLEQLYRNPPAPSFRPVLRTLSDEISAGRTFGEAAGLLGEWLPAFDIALLTAAEQSGRLDSAFGLLADYYEERARMWREVLGNLAYPVFLLHFAVFILPFPALFTSWDFGAYALKTLGVLLPLYLLIGAGVYASQSTHGEKWRSLLERLVGAVPVLGGARRKLALARLATALEALISAGVTIVEAWGLAASASGSPALMREVATWKLHLDEGATPAELLRRNPRVFPDLFANLYASGEISGKLDESLKRLHKLYKEEGTRQIQVVAQWVPRMIYLAVALGIAWKVIGFWTSYFDQVRDAGGF